MNITKWIRYRSDDEHVLATMCELGSNTSLDLYATLFGLVLERIKSGQCRDETWSNKMARRTTGELLHGREVLRRLEIALGSWLNLEECIVVSEIIANWSFQYEDGFIINDPREDGMLIGRNEAEAFASCFHADPDVTWLDINHGNNWNRPNVRSDSDRLMQRILSSANVRTVTVEDLPATEPIDLVDGRAV